MRRWRWEYQSFLGQVNTRAAGLRMHFYAKMNFHDLLVDSVSGYVDKAVQLGMDRDFRKTVSEQILTRSHVLSNDNKGIRQLKDFLEATVQKSIAQL